MLAAEAAFGALHEGIKMETYWDTLRNSWVWEELRRARNYRPVSKANHLVFSHLFPKLHFVQLMLCFVMLMFVKHFN